MKLRRDDRQDDGTGEGESSSGLVRSEEELRVDTVAGDAGSVGVRKHIDTDHVREVVSRGIEHGEVERTAPLDGDSGQVETLPDGSVSVPVFEEQLVVEKRLVVRERIIIRKTTVHEEHVVEADLQRERVELDVDDSVADRVHDLR